MTEVVGHLLSLWLLSTVSMMAALLARRALHGRSFGIQDTVLKLGLIGGPSVWLWSMVPRFPRFEGVVPSAELAAEMVPQGSMAASAPWNLALSAEATMAILCLWAIAASIQCVSLLRARLALNYLLAEDRLPSHGLWLSAQQLARRMRLGGVELLCSARIDMPCATGILRPKVIVPAWIERISPRSRRAILAHELAHHSRRDPLWLLLAALLAVLLPGHPLLKMTRQRLDSTAEMLSDERATRVLENPKDLAHGLGEVACRLRALPASIPVPALAARRGQLGDRVERILAGSPPGRSLSLWSGVPLIFALGFLPSIAVDLPGSDQVRLAPPAPPAPMAAPVPAGVPNPRPAPAPISAALDAADVRSDLEARLKRAEADDRRAELLARRAESLELELQSRNRQRSEREALRRAEHELQRQFEAMEQQRKQQQDRLEHLEAKLVQLQLQATESE